MNNNELNYTYNYREIYGQLREIEAPPKPDIIYLCANRDNGRMFLTVDTPEGAIILNECKQDGRGFFDPDPDYYGDECDDCVTLENDDYKYIVINNNVTIKKYKHRIKKWPKEILDCDYVFKVPETIDEYIVDGIDDEAFRFNNTITEIVLPGTVDFIGCYSFDGCWSLKKINLENIRKICSKAFDGCRSLKNIFLDKKCQLKPSSFDRCPNICIHSEVNIPNPSYKGQKSRVYEYARENFISFVSTDGNDSLNTGGFTPTEGEGPAKMYEIRWYRECIGKITIFRIDGKVPIDVINKWSGWVFRKMHWWYQSCEVPENDVDKIDNNPHWYLITSNGGADGIAVWAEHNRIEVMEGLDSSDPDLPRWHCW